VALRWLRRQTTRLDGHIWLSIWMLIRTAEWAILLHLIQIGLWAGYYVWSGAMPDLESAFYFSAVTYTTTGYGDIVLPSEWRLVGAVEALTGILMCGLSTGFFFAVVTKVVTARSEARSR
jgi:voltage-gated potassium channel Kch